MVKKILLLYFMFQSILNIFWAFEKNNYFYGWGGPPPPQFAENSAKIQTLPVLHWNKEFIASKLANMFAKVWCYSLGLLASCLRRWIFFHYVTFRFSHHLAIFLVIFQAIKHSIYNFFTFHFLACYELKKLILNQMIKHSLSPFPLQFVNIAKNQHFSSERRLKK